MGLLQLWLFPFLLAPVLVVVGVTDGRTGRIPNAANLAIATLGAGDAILRGGMALLDRSIDAALLGLLLLLLRHLYRRWRGRNGLGLGDVKFLSAATMGTGLGAMPMVILLACLSALVWIGVQRLRGEPIRRDMALRFGPHLAAGLFTVLVAERLLT